MHGRGRTNLPKWVSTWSNQWKRKCESNFNAKGCSGIRTAIVPKPAVASEGTLVLPIKSWSMGQAKIFRLTVEPSLEYH
jgi:hypothetical protein